MEPVGLMSIKKTNRQPPSQEVDGLRWARKGHAGSTRERPFRISISKDSRDPRLVNPLNPLFSFIIL